MTLSVFIRENPRLKVVLLALFTFASSCVIATTAIAEGGLSPQERRGKAIYLRGASPSRKEITAMVGDLDVPASTMTCAGCHGFRGEGKTEGGVTAGNLTWTNLVKPYGHTHPSGRKHGPFDEKLFTRSLLHGVDPAGNEMAVAMPRFQMSAEDIADLIAYLKRIEADRDPGLTETSITVGTILPKDGPLADIGAAMKDVLTAYFANVNDKGGIYNRRIELQTIDAGSNAAATAANMRTHVENGEVFAIVGGLSAGADKELAAVTREAEVPFMGPATLDELRALEEKYKFPPRHLASQLNAFAAAKIFTEALKRAGRDLSREKLITALEGLYEYDTGVTPSITFGPNRRVGAMGAYVLSIDPAKREFISSGWVSNN